MATYTVDTKADTIDPDDGALSLREALALADADPSTADTIDFAPGVQGQTIVLAGGQLTANSDVTIDGGSGVTIDADEKSRVLLIQGDGTDVMLAHLTITGGRTTGDGDDGGGIRADYPATLALDRSTVTGNSTAGELGRGGGISGHYVTLTDSTVSGNSTTGVGGDGGGISGYVTMTNSTVSGNNATGAYASGGGIYGTATLTNSTLSHNRAAGDGGGIFGTTDIVTLINSTVSHNSAAGDGGGAFIFTYDSAACALTNSTLTGNSAGGSGGGIIGDAPFLNSTVVNSIVAGNTTSEGSRPDIDGSIYSNGLNVFGSEVAGSLPSDRQNVAPGLLFAALDPLTGGGLLADNGGPTQTIALRDALDNPALSRADPETAPGTDQRGEPRPEPAGTNPDIGAFELNQSNPSPPPVGTTFLVTTTSDITADDGQLTLREALALADAENLTKDRIEFAAEVQGQTITLAGSQLTASSDVTVDGGAGVTIDADQASRVLLVEGIGTDVSLQHLTITGGRTTEDEGGGGISAGRFTNLALDHTMVSGNSATGGGGGISGYYVTLTNSIVSGNNATGDLAAGGGISGRYVTLTNSTVSGNNATGVFNLGGGISGYYVTLTNSTVSGNNATGDYSSGGGIDGLLVTMTSSTVSGNNAAGDGGGIAGGQVTVTDSTISGNSATHGVGGGIDASLVTVTNSTLSGNSVGGDYGHGGGIYSNGGYLTLTNSTVSANSATSGDGGGIFLQLSLGTFANSIVAGNVAGGVAPEIAGRITSSNSHNIFGSDVDGNAPGDLENVSTNLLFASLDPATGGGLLADNGGPTQTIALRDAPDNPALAGADPADTPATDQRGEARPQPAGTDPDLGAFELSQTAVPLNEIVGTSRGEFLSGTAGADLMHGLGGDDRLWGRPGDDLLFGDAGKDVLAGKAGIDQMTGGAEADRFLYRRPIDAPPDGPVLDQIMDFRRAQHDKVDLRPIDADQTAGGNQKFSFIGEQDITRAGQVRYEEVADGQFLVSGSTDRDPAPEFAFLVHADVAQLHASDFLL
jgi:hypothetical protein